MGLASCLCDSRDRSCFHNGVRSPLCFEDKSLLASQVCVIPLTKHCCCDALYGSVAHSHRTTHAIEASLELGTIKKGETALRPFSTDVGGCLKTGAPVYCATTSPTLTRGDQR
jgi:hypothetical protein